MMRRTYRHIEKMEYDLRFQTFLMKIMNISSLYPREQHLYPLMDRVAFKDLETAVLNAINDFAAEASNDNK